MKKCKNECLLQLEVYGPRLESARTHSDGPLNGRAFGGGQFFCYISFLEGSPIFGGGGNFSWVRGRGGGGWVDGWLWCGGGAGGGL